MARMRSRNRRGVLGLRNVKWRLLARLQMVEPRKGCAGTLGLGERNHFCARQYRATAIVTLVRHSCADVPHGGPYFAHYSLVRLLQNLVCYARNGGERRGSTCGLLAAELLFRESDKKPRAPPKVAGWVRGAELGSSRSMFY
jgi:hypothetical protein